MRGDTRTGYVDINGKISIHSPHEGRYEKGPQISRTAYNFNPPSPCGEILRVDPSVGQDLPISIHPPHAGRYVFPPLSELWRIFQSTLPMPGDTQQNCPSVECIAFQSTCSKCVCFDEAVDCLLVSGGYCFLLRQPLSL